MLSRLELIAEEGPVHSPEGIVYSTAPSVCLSQDGQKYYVKGPDREIVFAELAGCLLAKRVGLAVPEVGVARVNGEDVACSCGVESMGRNAMPFVRKRERLSNATELYAAIVVDVWLANSDRNSGNVVVTAEPSGTFRVMHIDFEKSVALRPSPTISSSLVGADKLWPSGELGTLLRRDKPLIPPTAILSSIRSFVETPDSVAAVIGAVTEKIGAVGYEADCIATVVNRGREIDKLAREVWTCN